MTHVFVKRDNGTIIDIPERDLEATLKRNPGWTIWIEPEEVTVKVEGFQCPICEFVAKTEQGLKVHKKKHL